MANLASDISPSQETEYAVAEDNSDICKRLTFGNIASAAISSIPQASTSSSSATKDEVQGEALQCFLRIRPFNESEQKSSVPMTNIDLFDDGHQIEIHAPEDSQTFKNGTRNPAENSWRFKFSSVLSQTAGQQDVFETTLLENVQDFVTGQNTLVFTYGATNGGKTYTMLGKPSDAGLIPRTLDTIFNSINHRLGTPYEMKPKNLSLVRLDDTSRTQELKSKNEVLASWDKREETFTSADISTSVVDDSLLANVNATMSYVCDTSSQPLPGNVSSDELSLSFVPEVDMNRQRDNRTRVSIEPQGKVLFSVFVSYAEIYNELIYDLLDKPPMTKHVRRVALKLSEDKSKRHHIKGLKEIEVRNADEAFKLLQIGQINRQVASTRLNQRSSRSHAIFTIKVLRVVDVNDPTYARVSSMSFVDLAGSERNRGADGLRLKEACNINTSLLTLGKCIEIMRFNQRNKCSAQRLVPFRESKLTRLFMGFFQGEGRVTMIVNINQIAAMFDDTYRVLRFSALARELVPGSHRPEPRSQKGSTHGTGKAVGKDGKDIKDVGEGKMAELGKLCTQHEAELGEYRRIVQSLRDELRQARMEKIELEVNIRREAAEEMAQQVIEIEESNEERVAETVSALEERHEQQLEILSKSIKRRYVKKRRRPNSDDEFDTNLTKFRGQRDAERLQAKCQELEGERMAVEEELTDRIHQMEREKSVLQYELSSKIEDAEQSAALVQKCAQLEEMVADLTQKLAAENARYCNLQEELGRMRHESNEEIQRKNAMAATIEELTRELLKARAEVVQLRHEQMTAREKAALRSRRGVGLSASCSLDTGTPIDEVQCLASELEKAQQRIAQSDTEHAQELEQANGEVADVSESLRDVKQVMASYEQEMLQLKDDLAQRNQQLQTFEERHQEQRTRIRNMEAADATAAAAALSDAEQRGADATGHSEEVERLKAQMDVQQARHATALSSLSSALDSATDEKDQAEFRLQEVLARHQDELERLTSRFESAQSDHSVALRALQARVEEAGEVEAGRDTVDEDEEEADEDEIVKPETTTTEKAVKVRGKRAVEDSNDDKENQAAVSDDVEKPLRRATRFTDAMAQVLPLPMRQTRSTMRKCNVAVERPGNVLAAAGGAPDCAEALDATQDFAGDVSAIGEDVVDPALVYDMETSVHEERDVTPGLGQKRKRFTRQCKKNTKDGAPAGAKRAKKMKDVKSSGSIADSDGDNNSRGSTSSIVSLLAAPFSKSSSKGTTSSCNQRGSPLAPTNNAHKLSRPRTRRKLLEKSQISSPISIAGCGPAMELTSRRQRR